MNLIRRSDPSELESFVGRRMNDSVELQNKCSTSHVARMTSGPAFAATKPFQILRQSMPWGTVGGNSGLYFCAFSASLDAFDYMLNRMIGLGGDGMGDDIMKISKYF